MDVYLIAISYYLTLIIGVFGLLLIASYLSDKLWTAIVNHYRLRAALIQVVRDKSRKKREKKERKGDD